MNNSSLCGSCAAPIEPHGPKSSLWCYTKPSEEFSNASQLPAGFYVDQDYFVATKSSDPHTIWYNQGFMTPQGDCVRNNCGGKCNTARDNSNCSYLCSGALVGTMPFPHSWTTGMTSNNAAAVLLPDNETLVQFQPLIRCAPGAPIFGISWKNFVP